MHLLNGCNLSVYKKYNLLARVLEKYPNELYDWTKLSFNPSITWDDVESNLGKPWDWIGLSCNPTITWGDIKDNLDKPWNWDGLSYNPSITWDVVKNNPDRPWDWEGLSDNPSITWDIVKSNPNHPWDWEGLSRNPSITWDIVKNNPAPWDWYYVYSRITDLNSAIKDLKENEKNLSDIWRGISANPNITMKIISENRSKIDFGELSRNSFHT